MCQSHRVVEKGKKITKKPHATKNLKKHQKTKKTTPYNLDKRFSPRLIIQIKQILSAAPELPKPQNTGVWKNK